MAYMVRLGLLIDAADEEEAYQLALRCAQAVRQADEGGRIVDLQVGSTRRTNPALDDSIANDSYGQGDAFSDWIIFSRSEAMASDGAGYWSNEYGWTTRNLATRFASTAACDLPMSAGADATWMLEPRGLHLVRLRVLQPGARRPVAFEAWAEGVEHAEEQARNAYPDGRMVGGHEVLA